jgi:hypothetical protein
MAAHEDPPVARDGTVITDEVAEELAREAEAGYDIDPLQVRPGPGRKSLAGGSGKSPRVNVRLSQELYDRLAAIAEELGQSISDLTREAIDRFVNRQAGAGRR